MSPYIFPGLLFYETTPEGIVEAVCSYYHISKKEIFKRSRQRKLALARQTAMYMLRTKTNMGFKQVGGYFDRDHTTAVHACRLIKDQMSVYPDFKKDINNILSRFVEKST